MNNKMLVILLAILTMAVIFLGWKTMSIPTSGSSDNAGKITLSTNPNPLRLGQVTFTIDVKDKNDKSVDNAAVFFDINMTTMNMGTQKGTAISQGKGQYAAVGNMSMRGPWRVRTTVKLPDGSSESKDFIVNVP